MAHEAPEVLNGPVAVTGNHRASVLAVRSGEADFAAIDVVTLRHLRAASEATGVKVIYQTLPTPGLPLICAQGLDGAVISDAVVDAIEALPKASAERLGLRGLVAIPAEVYLDVPTPPPPLH